MAIDPTKPLRTRLGRRFYIGHRKEAYTTWNQAGMIADLAEFCRASETTFHEDARVHAMYEGRRQVFLRIVQHLHLTDVQLMRLYGGQPLALTEDY